MKSANLLLLALSTFAGADLAFAQAPAPAVVAAKPLGSPRDWISPGDYPAPALRFEMEGITAFKLAVDTTGKPSRCGIVESSGFDVLDTATCQRLMANARFSPARDQARKPIEGTYSNRVRWGLPDGARSPVSERFGSMLLSIGQTGTVTSCRFVIHVPAEAPTPTVNPCEQMLNSPIAALGLEFRGNYQGSSADVEIQMADVFTAALRARVLSPVPGYEQRGLNIHRFKVTDNGKLNQCAYEEQRGSFLLATDFCGKAEAEIYDPPFSALDKDGIASGWHIMRVLLKTGQ